MTVSKLTEDAALIEAAIKMFVDIDCIRQQAGRSMILYGSKQGEAWFYTAASREKQQGIMRILACYEEILKEKKSSLSRQSRAWFL